VYVVGTAALQSNDTWSPAEQSSTLSDNDSSVTVGLGVGLGLTVAVLVVVVTVAIVRRLHASRPKSAVDRQYPAATAAAPAVAAAAVGSQQSWGFSSIRSKFSIASDVSVEPQPS